MHSKKCHLQFAFWNIRLMLQHWIQFITDVFWCKGIASAVLTFICFSSSFLLLLDCFCDFCHVFSNFTLKENASKQVTYCIYLACCLHSRVGPGQYIAIPITKKGSKQNDSCTIYLVASLPLAPWPELFICLSLLLSLTPWN